MLRRLNWLLVVCVTAGIAAQTPVRAQTPNPTLSQNAPPAGWADGHAHLTVNTHTLMDTWQIDLLMDDGPGTAVVQLTNRFTGSGDPEPPYSVIDCTHLAAGVFYKGGNIRAQYKLRWQRMMDSGSFTTELFTFAYPTINDP